VINKEKDGEMEREVKNITAQQEDGGFINASRRKSKTPVSCCNFCKYMVVCCNTYRCRSSGM